MGRVTSLIPVVLLFIVVAGAAWVGYQIYLYSQDLASRGQKSMNKRNIHLTADGGMRVGVKEIGQEAYADKTQSTIVKAWNLSSFPAYKSRLWNQEAEINQKGSSQRGSSRHSDHDYSSRSVSRHSEGHDSRSGSPAVGSTTSSRRPGNERNFSGLRHAS